MKSNKRLSKNTSLLSEEEVKKEAEEVKKEEEKVDICLICQEEFENEAPIFRTDCCKLRLHSTCWAQLEFESGSYYTRADYNRCP